jgi:hypothetical protein
VFPAGKATPLDAVIPFVGIAPFGLQDAGNLCGHVTAEGQVVRVLAGGCPRKNFQRST